MITDGVEEERENVSEMAHEYERDKTKKENPWQEVHAIKGGGGEAWGKSLNLS